MCVLLVCLVAALLPGDIAIAAPDTSPEACLEHYLDAVRQGVWPAARACWLPADLHASERLEIRYSDLPLKLDSASATVLERAAFQRGEITYSIGAAITDTAVARIPVELRYGNETVTQFYFAISTEIGWRLASPATAMSRNWPQQQSEFLDIHMQPPHRISATAVRTLDRLVTQTCERLEIPADRVELLRREKLGYLYCDKATVTDIVGAPTRGAALLQTDAVVTSEPCHLHELAHLLVNFALQDLPLYTLPMLQEGAAVALGGRWGRAPTVMHELGRFTLASDFIQIEELLTWHDFQRNLPDLTYAPSGVLVDFLLDQLGGPRFLALYRQLSGELATVQQLTPTTIQQRISTATGLIWPQLRTELEQLPEAVPRRGNTGP